MKEEIHLNPGKTFAFKSKAKQGPTFDLLGTEVHLPYDSVWFLVDQLRYEDALKTERLVLLLRGSIGGRFLLRFAGVSS